MKRGVKFVWVETDEFTGLSLRIFKNRKLAFESDVPVERLKNIEKARAAGEIRRQVLERQGDVCEDCPQIISLSTMHLHERQHRGQFKKVSDDPLDYERSGEMSVYNSVALCQDCHVLEHPEKAVMFTKRTEWEPLTR